jgi:hypothetical protein
VTSEYTFDLTKLRLTDLLSIELAKTLADSGLVVPAIIALSEAIGRTSSVNIMELPIAESAACLQAFVDALNRESESPDGVLRSPMNRKSDGQ